MEMLELKALAMEKVKSRKLSEDCYAASVACGLLTEKGNVYLGVCIDAPSGIGFCAEHAAIAQMVTNEETKIIKIVSVGEDGVVYPPCGRCREFIYQINKGNLETEVMVAEDIVVKLEELLPYRWN